MHAQTAVRTDQFRRFVPVPRSPAPPTIPALDGTSEREPLAQSMHLMGAVMSYPRNAEIFGDIRNDCARGADRAMTGERAILILRKTTKQPHAK